MLPLCVPSVCLSSENALNSEFCRRKPSWNTEPSLQEPRGDSRPQTFFFRGSAPLARRRGPSLGESALLGLQRIGGNDFALCGRENSSRVCRYRTRPDFRVHIFCV